MTRLWLAAISFIFSLALSSAGFAQTYSLAYFPASQASATELMPQALHTDASLASKPIFTEDILVGLKDVGQVFAFPDPQTLSHSFFIEGEMAQTADGFTISMPQGEADAATVKAFFEALETAQTASPATVYLNLLQAGDGALGAMHLWADELSGLLKRNTLVVLMAQPGAADKQTQWNEGAIALRRLLQGYADQAPFGNEDGTLMVTEAQRYLSRQVDTQGSLTFARIFAPGDAPVRMLDAQQPRNAQDELRYQSELAEAQFSVIMDDAEALRTYVDTCQFCPKLDETKTALAKIQQDDARFSAEVALADRVIASGKVQAIQAYLKTCERCPRRAEAESLLYALRKDQDRQAELDSFEQAQTYRDLLRLTDYLKTCRFCDKRNEASALRAQLIAENQDRELWDAARRDGSKQALESYIGACQACGYREAAEIRLAEIANAAAQLQELAQFRQAFGTDDVALLRTYVQTCQYCDRKMDAEAKLAALTRLAESEMQATRQACAVLAPRIASLQQQAGQVERDQALAACRSLLDSNAAKALVARVILAREAIRADELEQAQALLAPVTAQDLTAETAQVGSFNAVAHALTLKAWLLLESGNGTAQAEPLLDTSLSADDAFAGLILARLIVEGQAPGRSDTEAFALLQTPAEAGNAYAQTLLGWMYENGRGTQPSAAEAARLYQAAVDAGNATAMGYLGRLYERGQGVGLSVNQAANLFMQAIENGDAATAAHLTDDWPNRSSDLLRAIQQRLADRGLYTGALDGLFGPNTNAALRQLQVDNAKRHIPQLGLLR